MPEKRAKPDRKKKIAAEVLYYKSQSKLNQAQGDAHVKRAGLVKDRRKKTLANNLENLHARAGDENQKRFPFGRKDDGR
jgi:uncharacterized protein YpuA (DUF1002 family)